MPREQRAEPSTIFAEHRRERALFASISVTNMLEWEWNAVGELAAERQRGCSGFWEHNASTRDQRTGDGRRRRDSHWGQDRPVGRPSPADAEKGRPDRAPHNPSKIVSP
jgi:hypothetical protein